MDWEIRIALIVAGIGVIGYILFDYQRRKKSETSKKRLIEQMRESASQVDSTGFDFTGVGSARPANSDDSIVGENSDRENTAEAIEPAPELVPEKLDSNLVVDTPSDSEQVTHDAPTEQMDLTDLNEDEQNLEPEIVISLILRADEGATFKGKDFMPLLLSQGLRHGEMGIFHRHSGASGKPGPVLYSVANAINPGTFDLKNIEIFETPAFAFFMTLPGAGKSVSTYEAMVKTIRLLKSELGGQILDDTKSVFTEQTYQHQLDGLKEYVTKKSLER